LATVLTPLGSSPRSQRRHRAAWERFKAREKEKAVAIHWFPGSAREEAKSLIGFMERTGTSVKEMVALICCSDAEYEALCKWAEDKPTIAGKLDAMMAYRQRVLDHFQSMLEL
jgi:hypothetical protein